MNNEWPMSEAEISSHTSRISWFKSSFDNFSCHGSFFINSFTWLYIRLAYYSFILIILSYHRQFPSYPFFCFFFSLLDYPKLYQAMNDEIQTLTSKEVWELIPFPSGEKTACCTWVYAINVRSSGEVDYLKLNWWIYRLELAILGFVPVCGCDVPNVKCLWYIWWCFRWHEQDALL